MRKLDIGNKYRYFLKIRSHTFFLILEEDEGTEASTDLNSNM